jgi:hypothetical protein
MDHIQTLSTARGRALLRDVFRELRYEKQVTAFTALLTCWRLCVFERDIFRYSRFQVTAIHSLGFFAGSSLWMREIINRFYFSTINSLVYLGAAILLVVIASYRFTDNVDARYVIAGVLAEACLLFLLFVVMFFSPADDVDMEQDDTEDGYVTEVRNLITEVGEIGSDYADVAEKLDSVSTILSGLMGRQDELIASVQDLTRITQQTLSPTPEFSQVVRETNHALKEFTGSVHSFINAAEALHRDEIQRAIQREVERLLAQRIPQQAPGFATPNAAHNASQTNSQAASQTILQDSRLPNT